MKTILITCQILFFLLLPQAGELLADQACKECHQQQFEDWLDSDHAKAMSKATKGSVLGDFSNTSFEGSSGKAIFSSTNGKFNIMLETTDNITQYPVEFTFGHWPLQQYLIPTSNGKYQVFPYAWDSRISAEHGQRWIDIFDEVTSSSDRLHWLQPLQNWNGMCADCHSTELIRNYSPEVDTFNTQSKVINVSCSACHSLPENHAQQNTEPATGITASPSVWQRDDNERIAKLVKPAGHTVTMDTCFACHSLRSPMTDGFSSDTSFHDQFTPELLRYPLYHPDGQINEEVFVYGSFMQSKMAAVGVTCTDCHNPHNGKVQQSDNGLCSQCHSEEVFNTSNHHKHNAGPGAQCVDCHMPAKTYMKVDDRRDHSFHVPNLIISRTFETPLVCDSCHQDKGKAWVDRNFDWSTAPHQDLIDYAGIISGKKNQHSPARWLELFYSDHLDDMKRATLISQARYLTQINEFERLEPLLKHPNIPIRRATVQLMENYPVLMKQPMLFPMLDDESLSVRLAVTEALTGSRIAKEFEPQFLENLGDLISMYQQQSWRGEGRLSLSNLYTKLQQTSQDRTFITKAQAELRQAIAIEPYYDIAYINLADIYRALGNEREVFSILTSGIEQIKGSGYLHYSLGLHYIRVRNSTDALQEFMNAYAIDPDNAQFKYAYETLKQQMTSSQ